MLNVAATPNLSVSTEHTVTLTQQHTLLINFVQCGISFHALYFTSLVPPPFHSQCRH